MGELRVDKDAQGIGGQNPDRATSLADEILSRRSGDDLERELEAMEQELAKQLAEYKKDRRDPNSTSANVAATTTQQSWTTTAALQDEVTTTDALSSDLSGTCNLGATGLL